MKHPNTFPGHLAPALNLYNKHLSKGLSRSPLQWDSESLSFKSVTLQSLQFVPYYFNIFGICGFVGLASSMHLFLNSDTASWEILIVTTLAAELIIYLCLVCAPFLYYWKTVRHGFNCYNKLIRTLELQKTTSFCAFSNNAIWRRIAFTMQIVIHYYKWMPLVLIPGVLWMELDPTAYSLNRLYLYYNLSSSALRGVIWLLRAVLCSVFISEVIRFFVFFFVTFMYSFEKKVYALYMVANIPTEHDYIFGAQQLKWFRVLTVAERVWSEPSCTMIEPVLGGAFIFGITLNTFTIACSHLLPPFVYWILPLASLILFFVVNTVLTAALESTKISHKILDVKLFQEPGLTKHTMKRIQKVLKSSRLVTCSCGSLYTLTVENKLTFYYDVFLRTVDLIMLGLFD